jgi:FkbM family methyltransferase
MNARLQRALTRPQVERLISTWLRARTVRESGRFAVRELSGRRELARYRLRASGLEIYLRHGTPDIYTLDQAFYQCHFDPPPGVADVLAPLDPLRIVDLGANIGLFGAAMLGRYPRATVTAFEPDDRNADLLERTIAANGAAARWRVIRACAGATSGVVAFVEGEYGTSHVVDVADGGRQKSAVDVFPYLDDAQFAKIDIEGSEWELLADPRFAQLATRVIHLEFHPRSAPAPDPAAAAVRAVEEAGYDHDEVRETGPGTGMLWAWRPR